MQRRAVEAERERVDGVVVLGLLRGPFRGTEVHGDVLAARAVARAPDPGAPVRRRNGDAAVLGEGQTRQRRRAEHARLDAAAPLLQVPHAKGPVLAAGRHEGPAALPKRAARDARAVALEAHDLPAV